MHSVSDRSCAVKLFTKKTSWTLFCLVINLILILAVAYPNKPSITEPFLFYSHYLSLPLLPLPILSTQLPSFPLFLSFKFPIFILTPSIFVSFLPNIFPVLQNLFCPLFLSFIQLSPSDHSSCLYHLLPPLNSVSLSPPTTTFLASLFIFCPPHVSILLVRTVERGTKVEIVLKLQMRVKKGLEVCLYYAICLSESTQELVALVWCKVLWP